MFREGPATPGLRFFWSRIHPFGGEIGGPGSPIRIATHLPIPLVRDAHLGRFAVSGVKKGRQTPALFLSGPEPRSNTPPISGMPAPAPTEFFSGGSATTASVVRMFFAVEAA